jgi:hypothetical protein
LGVTKGSAGVCRKFLVAAVAGLVVRSPTPAATDIHHCTFHKKIYQSLVSFLTQYTAAEFYQAGGRALRRNNSSAAQVINEITPRSYDRDPRIHSEDPTINFRILYFKGAPPPPPQSSARRRGGRTSTVLLFTSVDHEPGEMRLKIPSHNSTHV